MNAEKYRFQYFGQGEMTAKGTYSCSSCGASDRERLYAYWLSEVLYRKSKPLEMAAIHFAPEQTLSSLIKHTNYFYRYHTVDLFMSGVDYKADLLSLPFEDNSYDFFICSHVLEHVTDDSKALSELYRITKSGGKGILMVPIIQNLPQTIEDPSITDEGERWRLFGQHDHVRLYARTEFVSRIRNAGFNLSQYGISYFGSMIFKKLGLKSSSVLYIASKP